MNWLGLGRSAVLFGFRPGSTMSALREDRLAVVFAAVLLLAWTVVIGAYALQDHFWIMEHSGYCACHAGPLPPGMMALAAGPTAAASILLIALLHFVAARAVGGGGSYSSTTALLLGSSTPVLLLAAVLVGLALAGLEVGRLAEDYLFAGCAVWCFTTAVLATAAEHGLSRPRALVSTLTASGCVAALLALRLSFVE